MVEVQQQAFATVEEAEPEKIVIDESKERAQDDVDETEANFAFSDEHLGAERGIAVHVLDVIGERGVGVMENRRPNLGDGPCGNGNVFMNQSRFKSGDFLPHQPQLGIGEVTTPSQRLTEKKVPAPDPESNGDLRIFNAHD